VQIRPRAIEHATLAVFFKRDLDAMRAQMIERCAVVVVCNRKGMLPPINLPSGMTRPLNPRATRVRQTLLRGEGR
jgi:hypothetical protein